MKLIIHTSYVLHVKMCFSHTLCLKGMSFGYINNITGCHNLY